MSNVFLGVKFPHVSLTLAVSLRMSILLFHRAVCNLQQKGKMSLN